MDPNSPSSNAMGFYISGKIPVKVDSIVVYVVPYSKEWRRTRLSHLPICKTPSSSNTQSLKSNIEKGEQEERPCRSCRASCRARRIGLQPLTCTLLYFFAVVPVKSGESKREQATWPLPSREVSVPDAPPL